MTGSVSLILCPPYWNRRPPLGLAFLEAALLQTGIDATVCDLNVEAYNQSPAEIKKVWLSVRPEATQTVAAYLSDAIDLDKLARRILADPAVYYCFSIFATNKAFSLQLIKKLKQIKPTAKIIVGGPEVLYEYFQGLASAFFSNPGVDHFVVGEGELALTDIIRGKAGRVVVHQECPDLDQLPFPRYQGFDLKVYQQQNMLPVLFSRGCQRRCAFCAECRLSMGFRMRSAPNMAEELEYHLQRTRTRTFIFHDSLINGDLEKLKLFCDMIIEKRMGISWEAQLLIRPDMPEQLLARMRESGCYNLFIGLESGSDRVLKLMNKGFTAGQAAELLKKVKSVGLHCEVSLITDFPGETKDDFNNTLGFLAVNQDIIPKIAQINTVQYLPGTSIRNLLPAKMPSCRVVQLLKFLKKHAFIYTPVFLENIYFN